MRRPGVAMYKPCDLIWRFHDPQQICTISRAGVPITDTPHFRLAERILRNIRDRINKYDMRDDDYDLCEYLEFVDNEARSSRAEPRPASRFACDVRRYWNLLTCGEGLPGTITVNPGQGGPPYITDGAHRVAFLAAYNTVFEVSLQVTAAPPNAGGQWGPVTKIVSYDAVRKAAVSNRPIQLDEDGDVIMREELRRRRLAAVDTNCFQEAVNVRLYNPEYNMFVFVSDDKKGPDHVVKAHPSGGCEQHDIFRLAPPSIQGGGGWTIFSAVYGMHLFVSNEKAQRDNVVKAHRSSGKELQDVFEMQYVEPSKFRIYNPTYDAYLFVSNDKRAGHNVVEAHGEFAKDEPRNTFQVMPVGPRLRLYNGEYDMYVFVSDNKHGPDNFVTAHKSSGVDRGDMFEIQQSEPGKYRLFNPAKGVHLFVSNNKWRGDLMVGAHRSHGRENSDQFELIFKDSDRFLIYSPEYHSYLFVSNDKAGGANMVEAHGEFARDEKRNLFRFR